MRVFVTGATGVIGSALVQELLGAGHTVVGLARSDATAATLAEWGVEAVRGELADTEGLAAAARASDGVIHLAFGHDFSTYAAAVELDLRAVEAMVGALEGSGKPIVIASGTLMASYARPATENDAPASLGGPRAAAEHRVLTTPGVRGAIVRLAPVVHGGATCGLLTGIIPVVREKGVMVYVGDGANVWPAVHRLDAARLFRLGLEKAKPGQRLHAAAEEGIPFKEIATTIGEVLHIPVNSVTAEEAGAAFGFFGGFLSIDNPTSSAITRQTVGWTPEQPGLLAGLRSGYLN